MAKKSIDYKAIQTERSKITESARKLAEAKRANSPYRVEEQPIFVSKLSGYVEEQEKKGKPLTIAGFMLAAGIPRRTWYKMASGEFDTMVEEFKLLRGIPEDADEYVTEDGEVVPLLLWSDIVERCSLLAQQQREEACIVGKSGNVIGNIFLLKAQHGLSDAPEQVQTQNNIQIVADAETALKALEMCK